MRPSSSTDPNAPYRAAINSLGAYHFFNGEHVEQSDTSHMTRQHSSFTELSPRRAARSDAASPIAEAGPSSASNSSIDIMKDYLREKGHLCDEFHDKTLLKRLNSTNISVETLLAAIKTAYNADHPLLATLTVNPYERAELINRLVVMASSPYGFNPKIKAAVQNSQNPEQLIASILHYLRNLKGIYS